MDSDLVQSLVSNRPEPLAWGSAKGALLGGNPAWWDYCRRYLPAIGPPPTDTTFFDQLPARYQVLWRSQAAAACLGRTTTSLFSLHKDESNCRQGSYVRFAPLSLGPGPPTALGWSLLIVETDSLTPCPEESIFSTQDKPSAIPPPGTDTLLAEERANRQQAEINLQESKDRLTQIIHGNSIATFVIDRNHRITHWNKALERMTGFSSEMMVGTNRQWQAFYDHERPTMADLILDRAPEEKIRQLYTDKYIRSQHLEDSYEVEDYFEMQGRGKWLLFTAAPIKSGCGELIGAVETLQDITRRKTMEQEVLHYQTVLENKVEERTLQLKATYEQLLHAEKLSAVGKLAASIAHEFGNPIIGIRNFLKGIQKTTRFEPDDAELLQLAINECQRVRDLIRNLQSFNRPTSGTMEPLDLHQAINDILLFCKKIFREKRIVVKKKFATNLPLVNAVHDQIKQVILNCLNNAQEAMPSHGGTIFLSTEQRDDRVLVHIRDTGKGILESDMVYIFEPFFSTKPTVEGTGLGLSVSYGIMKHHKGSIEVSDTSSHGTTFTLNFPALLDSPHRRR